MALDKQVVIEEALELLREGGLTKLTTRRLADRLGVKSASLYYHFSNKRELLDYVTDTMLRPVWRGATPGEDWRDWLYSTGIALRRQMLSYTDGAIAAAGTSPPDVAGDTIQGLFAPLKQAGFPHDQARVILFAALRFVGGWANDEQVAHARGADRPTELNEQSFRMGLRAIIRGFAIELSPENGTWSPATFTAKG